MFNDRYGLTQAVLDGRKTQTRRIIPESVSDKIDKFIVDYYNATFDALNEMEALRQYFLVEKIGKLPYKVGEVVAVAQSYKDCGFDPNISQIWTDKCVVIFENNPISQTSGWNNKLFVRAALMRHFIRITGVRVERLQDISESDIKAEGVDSWICRGKRYYGFFDYSKDKFVRCNTLREAYAALIDKIAGKGVWRSNPYVFVYEFELAK